MADNSVWDNLYRTTSNVVFTAQKFNSSMSGVNREFEQTRRYPRTYVQGTIAATVSATSVSFNFTSGSHLFHNGKKYATLTKVPFAAADATGTYRVILDASTFTPRKTQTAALFAAGHANRELAKVRWNAGALSQLVNKVPKGGPTRCVLFSYNGTVMTGVRVGGFAFEIPWKCRPLKAKLDGGTSPSGRAQIWDMNIGGASIFTAANRVRLAAGSKTGSQSSFSLGSFDVNDVLTFDVDQCGSARSGANVTAQLNLLVMG